MAHYQYEGQHFQLPDGLSNEEATGKIKTHLGQATSKASFTPGTIPGQEGEAERVAGLQAARKAQPGEEKLKDILGGVGETALSLGTSMYAGVQAPIAAGMKRAAGMVPDWEKETARLMEENTYAPRGEKGQEYTAAAGDVANRYLAPFGLSGVRAMAGLPDLVGRAKLKNKMGKEPTVPETIPVDREALIRGKKPVETKPTTPAQDIRVGKDGEAYVSTPETEFARDAAANRMVDENERIYNEQQQQNLFAMPERAVQEELPFHSSVEDIAAKQAEGQPQADMFAGNKLPEMPPEAPRMLSEQGTGVKQGGTQGQVLPVAGREFPKENIQVVEQPALQRAVDKMATGRSFDLTSEERIAWNKAEGNIARVDEFTPMDPKLREYLRSEVVQSAEYVQKQKEINRTFDQRISDIERMNKAMDASALREATKRQRDLALQKLEDRLIEQAYKPTGDGQGPKTRAAKARINKFGQGGQAPMIGDLAEGIVNLGRGLKAIVTPKTTPKPDTILTPRSAATIAAKQEKSKKALAIGLKDSVYSAPTTIEEVVANPGKDIGFKGAAGYTFDRPISPGQDLTPGTYAVLRKNKDNKMMSFHNRNFTKARLDAQGDSIKYVTGKDGYFTLMEKLTPEEKMTVHQDSKMLDKHGTPWTPELAQQLGYSPAMKAFMDKRMETNARVADVADGALNTMKMKLLNRRESYAAANFDKQYRALVGEWKVGANGKKEWVTHTFLTAQNPWELNQAKAWAKEKFGVDVTIEELPRRGLKTEGGDKFRASPMDPNSKLLQMLSESVPEIGSLKAELDLYIDQQSKNLFGHSVHELHKKGVTGSLGDRPWLDAKRNAEDFFRGEATHIEEALKYWHTQEAIGQTRKMLTEPSLSHMQNTIGYLNRWLSTNFYGGLNDLGVLTNNLVDFTYMAALKGVEQTNVGIKKVAGKGYQGWSPNDVPRTHLGELRDVASAKMMGVFAPVFTALQVAQTYLAMPAELLRMRSEFGANPTHMVEAMVNAHTVLPLLGLADLMGKLDNMDMFPQHLKDAYVWGKEHGLTKYNEIEQSHAQIENPNWYRAKSLAAWPSKFGELASGPVSWMAAVDMLHKSSGMTGDNLFLGAFDAYKYTMTEYHHEAGAMVYSRTGIVGTGAGGLKKYVHNAADQQVSRAAELNKHPAAFAYMVGGMALTMGATGVIGYNLANALSMALTDHDLRYWWDELFGKGKASQGFRDGFASMISGYDLQARMQMGDAIPTDAGEALAGAHLTTLFNQAGSIYKYAKNPDQMSFNEMARKNLPAGMVGWYEQNNMVDKQGNVLDKEGQNKYPAEMARTPGQQKIRSALSLRPIKERLYDEQKYNADVIQKKVEKKRSEAKVRMNAAMGYNDPQGFKAAIEDFIAAEGDIETLDASTQKYYREQKWSSKQRAGGLEPKATIPSIKKWERYQDK
jgi:hypothetical protein